MKTVAAMMVLMGLLSAIITAGEPIKEPSPLVTGSVETMLQLKGCPKDSIVKIVSLPRLQTGLALVIPDSLLSESLLDVLKTQYGSWLWVSADVRAAAIVTLETDVTGPNRRLCVSLSMLYDFRESRKVEAKK
jgi:hypothetical protein